MSLSSAPETTPLCARNDSCCRICLSTGNGLQSESLVNPCNCRGSIGLVHTSCLETWLMISNSDCCDLCGYHLRLEKTPKSLLCWIKESDARIKCYIITDLISFLFLTPTTTASLDLCRRGLTVYAKSCWEVAGLMFLITLLVSTYVMWLTTCLVQHFRNWKQWQASNNTVRLSTGNCRRTSTQIFTTNVQSLNHAAKLQSNILELDEYNFS